jgi:hypothetical protein
VVVAAPVPGRRIAAMEHYADLAAGWDHESWERQHETEKRGGTA